MTMKWWQTFKKRLIASTSSKQPSLGDCNWISIDLELNSLDINQCHILSIGGISGRGFCIDMNSGFHQLIKQTSELNQSPTIHGITEADLSKGDAIAPSLHNLFERSTDKVWVMHCHAIDWKVLKRYFTQYRFDIGKPVIIDTLLLEQYLLNKESLPLEVDLISCLHRHNISHGTQHNALEDANVTLQLLFSQLNTLGLTPNHYLSDLKHTGAIIHF